MPQAMGRQQLPINPTHAAVLGSSQTGNTLQPDTNRVHLHIQLLHTSLTT
jgi:hypothetical protein